MTRVYSSVCQEVKKWAIKMNLLGEFKANSGGTQARTHKAYNYDSPRDYYSFLLTIGNGSLIFYCIYLKIEIYFTLPYYSWGLDFLALKTPHILVYFLNGED